MPFDTHAAVKVLTGAGASEEVAVAVVNVAQGAAAEQGRELATRADISGLRAMLDAQREATRADTSELRATLDAQREATRADTSELRAMLDAQREATRTDIAELRATLDAQREATRADIETLRETTRADIAELRAEHARAETRLIKWVVGTALVVGALIVGVLRLPAPAAP